MSASGDLRARLEEIHDMMPLSDRERKLAEWVLYGDGEVSIAEEIQTDSNWWGPKAVEVLKTLEAE